MQHTKNKINLTKSLTNNTFDNILYIMKQNKLLNLCQDIRRSHVDSTHNDQSVAYTFKTFDGRIIKIARTRIQTPTLQSGNYFSVAQNNVILDEDFCKDFTRPSKHVTEMIKLIDMCAEQTYKQLKRETKIKNK